MTISPKPMGLPSRRIFVSGRILKVCAFSPFKTIVCALLLMALMVPRNGRVLAAGWSAAARVMASRSEVVMRVESVFIVLFLLGVGFQRREEKCARIFW